MNYFGSCLEIVNCYRPGFMLKKQYMTKTIQTGTVVLLIANLVPLWGMLFNDWPILSIFTAYMAETVLIGLITVIGILVYGLAGKSPQYGIKKSQNVLALALRFFIHYNFFVAVQMLVFLVTIGLLMPGKPDTDGFWAFFHPFRQTEFITSITALASGHFILFMFQLLSGSYKKTKPAEMAAQPYLRIFVQQFAIILGGIALILLARFSTQATLLVFGIGFILAKLVFEAYYPMLVRKVDFNPDYVNTTNSRL